VKQLGLIFTNVPRTQAVRGTVEPSRKIFDGVDVTAYSFFRVVKPGVPPASFCEVGSQEHLL